MEVRRRRAPGHQAGPPGGELTSASGKRGRPPAWRLACYAFVLAAGLPLAWRAGRPADPAVDIAALLGSTASVPGQSSYRSGGAALFLTGDRGWTLSLYTGTTPRFEADFVVVRRFDGVLTVDLILDPRAAGHVAAAARTAMPEVRLAGQAALEFLARAQLDVHPFDALVGRSDVARAHTAPATSAR